jgi:hypothetical protein
VDFSKNGYTARRRSLIEDAKFESAILKDDSLEDVRVLTKRQQLNVILLFLIKGFV